MANGIPCGLAYFSVCEVIVYTAVYYTGSPAFSLSLTLTPANATLCTSSFHKEGPNPTTNYSICGMCWFSGQSFWLFYVCFCRVSLWYFSFPHPNVITFMSWYNSLCYCIFFLCYCISFLCYCILLCYCTVYAYLLFCFLLVVMNVYLTVYIVL
jgi:hypothetical protein